MINQRGVTLVFTAIVISRYKDTDFLLKNNAFRG